MPLMPSKDFVKPAKDGCFISIDASPGAAQSELMKVNEWRGALEVRIAAEPKDGAANEELLRFLASKLGVPVASLAIVKGSKSSRKVVHARVDADKARSALGGA